jgi:hypothetical protein
VNELHDVCHMIVCVTVFTYYGSDTPLTKACTDFIGAETTVTRTLLTPDCIHQLQLADKIVNEVHHSPHSSSLSHHPWKVIGWSFGC